MSPDAVRREPAVTSAGRFNAGFEDVPDEYDELRAHGHMAGRRFEHFSRVVAASAGDVLELGCGTGTLLRALAAAHPDRRFHGVEPLGNYVDFATRRAAERGLGNVRFSQGTGEDLDAVADAGEAGLVITVDTLHHVFDGPRVVRQVHRAARRDGRWVAMEPNRVHPYVWAYHVLTDGERTFPSRRFLRHAAAAGWQLQGRSCMYLFPSGVATVPGWAERLERRFEGFRPTAGAVVLDLLRR
ncbi:class I SAM-dependent methyltransferase [Klenkia brasiliensis]|uniref:Methyltransferase domain-containing protein n=1 Tax=Klenkia brasiliensis TaxID=333142 RepID=A0A1G7RDP1_9ACTN|nr:class I SAM-dependent methyltransferase [Klenkia brasiliensis]SDG08916.1 Methyltransferase domain-containing protein [Klenkia brasiliensis]